MKSGLSVLASPFFALAALAVGAAPASGGQGPTHYQPTPSVAPVITAQPVAPSAPVAVGKSVSLGVTTTGTTPDYQWFLYGERIRGATSATYSISSVSAANAGAYSCSVSNRAGSVTSSTVLLSVVAQAGIVTSYPADAAVNSGATVSLGASSGTGLTYAWALNGSTISGATSDTLKFSPAGATDAGTYAVTVSNKSGDVGVYVATLSVTTVARLTNLSVKGLVGSGSEVLTAGFIINGTGSDNVLLVGLGPGLGSSGLAAPELSLYGSWGKAVASNTGWKTSANESAIATELSALKITLNSGDDAILQELGGGAYTAQVTGPSGASGEALAELFDTNSALDAAPDMVNVSGRAYVGGSTTTLTAGFIITGSTSDEVLVRGDGPSLRSFGVPGTVPATTVAVYNSSGTAVATNAGWGNDLSISSAGALVGAFPLWPNSQDSALLLTLAPGAYTAIVTGASGATGTAMVEVYEVK